MKIAPPIAGSVWRWGRVFVIPVMILLLVVGGRFCWMASHHVSQAREAVSAGEWDAALDQYTRAIRYYIPGNPYSREAVQSIRSELLAAPQIASSTPEQVRILKQTRGALLGIRSVVQPYAEHLQWVDEQLTQHRETDEANKRSG